MAGEAMHALISHVLNFPKNPLTRYNEDDIIYLFSTMLELSQGAQRTQMSEVLLHWGED